MPVLYNERTLPLAPSSINPAFSSGLNLAFDFTGIGALEEGEAYVYAGATRPKLTKTGTQTLTTVNGEPGRVATSESLYDYTNLNDYGLQVGNGDFTIAIRFTTPTVLPTTSHLRTLLTIRGSAGIALSIVLAENTNVGWYVNATGSTSCPLGSASTAYMFGVETTGIAFIQRIAGVTRIYTAPASGANAQIRYNSGAAATTPMDSTWAARVIVNHNVVGSNVSAAIHSLRFWNIGLDLPTITALAKNYWAAEANSVEVADTTAPTVTAAAVSNNTPAVVSLTASEGLDPANVPAASAFTVSGHTVSSVAISGATINLTVTPAFVNAEAARTVSYTQPGTANARDMSGNLLANFTGQAITNNVAAPVDSTPPAFASAQVVNAQPAVIQVTMNETLAASVPAASAFSVSGGRTVSGVSINGAVVSVTVDTPYVYGDTITVAYTQPGANPRLQDAAGNLTATFTAQSVTNSIDAPPSGSFTSDRMTSSGTLRGAATVNYEWHAGGTVGVVAGTVTYGTTALGDDSRLSLSGLPPGAGYVLVRFADGGICYQPGTVT